MVSRQQYWHDKQKREMEKAAKRVSAIHRAVKAARGSLLFEFEEMKYLKSVEEKMDEWLKKLGV
jgi:hypothetical protein